MKTVLALTASAIMSVDARMGFGSCPDVSVVQNLDKAAFAGKWYEIKRDASFTYEFGQECSTQEYKLDGNGDLSFIFRTFVPMMAFTYQSIDGTMYKCDETLESGATCKFTMAGVEKVGELNIMATDYNNWAVHYNCMEGMGMHMSWLNIVSKEMTLSADLLQDADNAIQSAIPDGYDLSWLTMHTT